MGGRGDLCPAARPVMDPSAGVEAHPLHSGGEVADDLRRADAPEASRELLRDIQHGLHGDVLRAAMPHRALTNAGSAARALAALPAWTEGTRAGGNRTRVSSS